MVSCAVEMATAQRTQARAVVGPPRRAAWQLKSALRNSISAAPRAVIGTRDGANNKKCIRMLRCIRKPCSHAAPHRIQTQLSSHCTTPHHQLNIL